MLWAILLLLIIFMISFGVVGTGIVLWEVFRPVDHSHNDHM